MAPPLPLIFLLMIHRVSSSDWGVNYSHLYICALKNSSVIMSCNYTYPTGYKIEKVFWTKNPVNCENSPDLSEDPEYSQRLQYLGDKQQNCTIRLSHVTQKDSHMYYFRFTTDKPDGKWTGKPGVNLSVTDPPKHTFVAVSPCCELVEGNSVNLSCNSDSYPPALNFSWFKGGTFVGSGRIYSISKISSNHSGEYKCKSITEHGEKYSDAVTLNVTCVGCLVKLYTTGVVCGAAVVIMMVLIWVKKRKDTQESQMNQSKLQAPVGNLTESVYENLMDKPLGMHHLIFN
ncbi:hypothetical protein cypCar_00047194 [Cyprinus carpio]|nr:hypothetical protein cypCar_00047194 [Cyprinus carpio]